ncbi:MAG: hypothetical protein ACNS63_00940 [Candidatus Nitrospinota bacterium M3_3B_026]
MKTLARGAVLTAFIVSILAGQAVCFEKVPVTRRIEGSFLTNVAGSSLTQPPYIQVIRSREGLEYLLNGFERHKNRITKARIDNLRKRLSRLDYGKQMVVGVFSQPMDNYSISMNSILMDEKEKSIEVKVSYRHKMVNYRIPPKKSIHYVLAVVPKSDYPVILKADQVTTSSGAKETKIVTVTGRLMPLRDDGLQLVPVVIKRGNKNSYYINGPKTEALSKHIGKVVTLEGAVSHERDSPYEWDFLVKKIVKIHN